ncbi:Ig-like domain-containing protein [Periweissella cryptocerci]|nr:InlB B-repeat-containing protein [Periweissella cryptocerci]
MKLATKVKLGLFSTVLLGTVSVGVFTNVVPDAVAGHSTLIRASAAETDNQAYQVGVGTHVNGSFGPNYYFNIAKYLGTQYTDLKLTGDSATSTVTGWTLKDQNVAYYNGVSQPTTISFSYTDSDGKTQNKTVTLSADLVRTSFNLTFKIAPADANKVTLAAGVAADISNVLVNPDGTVSVVIPVSATESSSGANNGIASLLTQADLDKNLQLTFLIQGYGLTEWNTKADGTGTALALNKLAAGQYEDQTFYAVVKNTTNVRFKADSTRSDSVDAITASLDDKTQIGTVTAPDVTAKPGYRFDGWAEFNSDGTSVVDGDGKQVIVQPHATASVKRGAYFEARYTDLKQLTVTLNTGKGTFSYTPATVSSKPTDAKGNNLYVATDYYDDQNGFALGSIPTPELANYQFDYWTDAQGKQVASYPNPKLTGATTYYAHYTALPKYSLTYDLNGGQATKTSETVYFDNNTGFTLPAGPTKQGTEFAYWLGSDGKAYAAASGVNLSDFASKTLTFKAVYTADVAQYQATFVVGGTKTSVKFSGNLLDGTTASIYDGNTATLQDSTGATFDYWLGSDGKVYGDYTTLPASDITLTAVFVTGENTGVAKKITFKTATTAKNVSLPADENGTINYYGRYYLPYTTPTADGQVFAYYTDGKGNHFQPGDAIAIADSGITLTAVFNSVASTNADAASVIDTASEYSDTAQADADAVKKAAEQAKADAAKKTADQAKADVAKKAVDQAKADAAKKVADQAKADAAKKAAAKAKADAAKKAAAKAKADAAKKKAAKAKAAAKKKAAKAKAAAKQKAAKPKLKVTVKHTVKKFTGTTTKGVTVKVYNAKGKLLGKAKANAKGKFTIKLKKKVAKKAKLKFVVQNNKANGAKKLTKTIKVK